MIAPSLLGAQLSEPAAGLHCHGNRRTKSCASTMTRPAFSKFEIISCCLGELVRPGVIDLGKNSCRVAGLDGSGKVILWCRMQRKTIWAWPLSSRPASLRWKPAAAPIIWDGFFGSGTHSSADVA